MPLKTGIKKTDPTPSKETMGSQPSTDTKKKAAEKEIEPDLDESPIIIIYDIVIFVIIVFELITFICKRIKAYIDEDEEDEEDDS
jgi:hypothetical protein